MSLLDAIHLCGMLVIAVATAASAAWSSLHARGWDEHRIRWWDIRLMLGTAAAFVVANVALIAAAAAAG